MCKKKWQAGIFRFFNQQWNTNRQLHDSVYATNITIYPLNMNNIPKYVHIFSTHKPI